MHGICSILRDSRGLKNVDNYHEFCRLLSRVKANFQLNELVAVDTYEEFINGVAQFTVMSFHNWDWASNSLHYLLGLWEQMVISLTYFKSDSKPLNLLQYCPLNTSA